MIWECISAQKRSEYSNEALLMSTHNKFLCGKKKNICLCGHGCILIMVSHWWGCVSPSSLSYICPSVQPCFRFQMINEVKADEFHHIEICFGIANGQISSIFDRIICPQHDIGGVLSFHVISPLFCSSLCWRGSLIIFWRWNHTYLLHTMETCLTGKCYLIIRPLIVIVWVTCYPKQTYFFLFGQKVLCKRTYPKNQFEVSGWLSGQHSWPLITRSHIWILLEAEFSSWSQIQSDHSITSSVRAGFQLACARPAAYLTGNGLNGKVICESWSHVFEAEHMVMILFSWRKNFGQ